MMSSPAGVRTSANARSNAIGSVTRCRIPKHRTTSKRSPRLAHVERVHPLVVNVRVEHGGNRVEAGTAGQGDAEPGLDPVDVLLVVDRDNATRAPPLGQEAVEAVEGPNVQHAAPGEAFRAQHRKTVDVVPGQARRVDAVP